MMKTDAPKIALKLYFLLLLPTGLMLALVFGLDLVYTETDSVPIGIYRGCEGQAKDLFVKACVPEPFVDLGKALGVLAEGDCKDGTTPLLKKVVASEGDHFRVTRLGVFVNSNLITNSQPVNSLAPYPATVDTVVPPGHVIALGTNTNSATSFDSRYLGPLKPMGYYCPFLTAQQS